LCEEDGCIALEKKESKPSRKKYSSAHFAFELAGKTPYQQWCDAAVGLSRVAFDLPLINAAFFSRQ